MTDESYPPAELRGDLSWPDRVIALHDGLLQAGLPYAFGGAIALNYHREPRATLDIDINIFLDPSDEDQALDVLRSLSALPDEDKVRRELAAVGQTRSLWDKTYVDLFFSNTDFHQSMAARVVYESFAPGIDIPVLSIEDLMVCKVLFDRPKDWLDIEAVVKTRGTALDLQYMGQWLSYFLPADDNRLGRLQTKIADAPDNN